MPEIRVEPTLEEDFWLIVDELEEKKAIERQLKAIIKQLEHDQ